jgi:predicted transcriptional regulator
MAKKKKAAAAAGAVMAARENPYVQRIIEDDDLRDNVRVAFEAARQAYERVSRGKAPAKVLEDKKFHKELQTAAEALKKAGESLREAPKKKRKRKRKGRKLLLLVLAAGLAIALSEDLRNKILDALFGAEEEFEYTSTTTPSTPPASGS